MSNAQDQQHTRSGQVVHGSTGCSSDHGQGPARKKMRKGTKSCLECRRRKIKCTFEPGRPQICNECYTRGSACIDQEHGDLQAFGGQPAPVDQSEQSLRERVLALEGLVKQVLDKLPDGQQASGPSSVDGKRIDVAAVEALKSLRSGNSGSSSPPRPGQPQSASQQRREADDDFLPDGVQGDAPALTLFDNAVLQRTEKEPVLSRAQYNKNRSLLDTLNGMLPSAHDLNLILESSHQWWVIWRKMFVEIADQRCHTMKEAVSHSLRSDKPAEIAKIMLCIAISLHQMSDSFDWSRLQLREPRSQLMDNYMSAVDKLIISDDEVAATIEGVECIVLASKHHINMGRPRRAWLLNHRAIAFCQLLGFHRLLSQPDHSNPQFRRSLGIWSYLIMSDRALALLLGIPYTVPEPFCSPLFAPGMSQRLHGNAALETYLFRLLPVVTQIVERNQAPVPLAYSVTMRLDQELEELYASQDPCLWTTDPSPSPGQEVEEYFDRLQAQMFHYQTRLILHMPFMLRSSDSDKRYHYSHACSLDSARHMIRCYEAIRSPILGPYICKLTDFQAFTAAMLLLLNQCGYASVNRATQHHPYDPEQDRRDSELIYLTISLLRDASKELGGSVATQSLQVLELLSDARQGGGGNDGKEAKEGQPQSCQVSIPYFGTISVTKGKSYRPFRSGAQPPPGEARTDVAGGGGASQAYNAGAAKLSGLPTPPSVASCCSAQQSPMPAKSVDLTTTSSGNVQPRPQYDLSSGYMALNPDQPWNGDIDPFITFDAFMALPQQSLSKDFPADGGFTPQQQQQQQQYESTASDNVSKIDDGHGKNEQSARTGMARMGGFGVESDTHPNFPFGGLPASQGSNNGTTSTSNIDLDQGWNWFGMEAPIMP